MIGCFRSGRNNHDNPVAKKAAAKKKADMTRVLFRICLFYHDRMYFMKKITFKIFALVVLIVIFIFLKAFGSGSGEVKKVATQKSHWFVLHRKANIEYLYFGEAGNVEKSTMLRKFSVKAGIPGEKPTPLPSLLGRDYWLVVGEEESKDNPETSPYFLRLDVPVTEEEPYGPVPYEECDGQCNWTLPGYFGLHGVNGDFSKLSELDAGSSGCVRHKDYDITYLYNLLDPKKEQIRYYIKDI